MSVLSRRLSLPRTYVEIPNGDPLDWRGWAGVAGGGWGWLRHPRPPAADLTRSKFRRTPAKSWGPIPKGAHLEFQVGLAWIGAGGRAFLGVAGDGRTIPRHLLPTQSTEVRGTRAEGW